MLVSQAIPLLQESELKQLHLKTVDATIIGFLNLAVLEIYKRFNLWQAEAVVTMVADKLLYKLDGVDADVDIDLSESMLLMIDQVYDNTGVVLTLNDETDEYSVMTPQYHQVEVVEETAGETLGVIYRAAPAFMTATTDEILVPPQFLEAVFNYVGFKGHGSIKSDIRGENNTHYLRFVASCQLIHDEGLFAQDSMDSNKFDQRGFV
jgi:hypothetical protein